MCACLYSRCDQSAVSVFRALGQLEKNVHKCDLVLDTKQNFFAITFHCKFGLFVIS